MGRIDYYNDPDAPAANSLVPGASAVVADESGAILLHRRTDNGLWALPGGTMDIGETIRTTVIREVKEETGLDVEPLSVIGIYSDPERVFAYSDGEVRQEFSVCFACRIVGGALAVSDESHEVAFFPPQRIDDLPMHPTIGLRIQHHLERRPAPVVD